MSTLTQRLLALVVTAGSAGLGVAATTAPSYATGSCTPAVAATAAIDTAEPATGQAIAFHGSGWTTCNGTGSTVAVKMIDAASTKYARPNTSVNADTTIWAIVHANASGDFDGSFVLPDGTTATSKPALPSGALQLAFLTGSLDDADPIRSVRVGFTLGDVDPTDPGDPTDPTDPTGPTGPTCTPTTATAQVHVPATASMGGLLHVTGSGWCNPAGGGSVIGVKIDDGGYSHLDDTLDANLTIWAEIRAGATDGTFATDLRLPDGTARTSSPAFTRGAHTLRLLTGSLAAGDQVRSVESTAFSIGAYRPNALPAPIDATVLKKGARHGLKLQTSGSTVVLSAPGLAPGTWVYPSLYAADGSPRTPWSTWRRIDKHHRLRLSLAGTTLTGRLKLVLQSGQDGQVGDLLGWAPLDLGSTPSTTPTTSTSTPTTTPTVPTATLVAPGSVAPGIDVPLADPAPAYRSFAGLDPRHHGSVTAAVANGVATLTVRTPAESGDPVFVRVYTPDGISPAGWARLDEQGQAHLDLSSFSGYVGVTVQAADGTLLGWAPIALGSGAAATGSEETAVAVPTDAAPPAVDRPWIGATDGVLLSVGALVLAGTSLFVGVRRPGVTA